MKDRPDRNRVHGRLVFVRALGLLIGFLAVHCGSDPDAAPGIPAEDPSPTRIVVMAPAAAEMLAALGTIDRVVGVGDFVDEPGNVADLPRVGSYDAPNVERVLSLRADLLVTASSQAAASAHRRLEALGIGVLALDTSTYDGVFRSLAAVGRRLDRQAEAGALELDMKHRLETIRERAYDLPKRRVLFVVGRDPVYVAGPGSHVDEMIRIAGGANVAHDLVSPYSRISMEAVLERMPEVVIDTSDNRPGTPRGRINGEWADFAFMPAVRDRRVYSVDPARLVIPGIRLPEMTLLMGKLIHPETFGEPTDDELRGSTTSGAGTGG